MTALHGKDRYWKEVIQVSKWKNDIKVQYLYHIFESTWVSNNFCPLAQRLCSSVLSRGRCRSTGCCSRTTWCRADTFTHVDVEQGVQLLCDRLEWRHKALAIYIAEEEHLEGVAVVDGDPTPAVLLWGVFDALLCHGHDVGDVERPVDSRRFFGQSLKKK